METTIEHGTKEEDGTFIVKASSVLFALGDGWPRGTVLLLSTK
jgi:hypothetical protein